MTRIFKDKITNEFLKGSILEKELIKEIVPNNDIFETEQIEEVAPKKKTKKEKDLERQKKYEEHYEQVKIIKRWNSFQKKNIIPSHWQLFRNANTQFLSLGSIVWSQQEGLVAGVPDLTCIIDNQILFIEMKRFSKKPKTARGKIGGLNEAQLERFPMFEKCGFTIKICYSSNEAFDVLSDFTKINFSEEKLDQKIN